MTSTSENSASPTNGVTVEQQIRWGDLDARVSLSGKRRDIKRLRIIALRSGATRSGLFADTEWVTPSPGQPATISGDALFLRPNRKLKLRLRCAFEARSRGDITVTFDGLMHGDRRGRVLGALEGPLVWTATESGPQLGM